MTPLLFNKSLKRQRITNSLFYKTYTFFSTEKKVFFLLYSANKILSLLQVAYQKMLIKSNNKSIYVHPVQCKHAGLWYGLGACNLLTVFGANDHNMCVRVYMSMAASICSAVLLICEAIYSKLFWNTYQQRAVVCSL